VRLIRVRALPYRPVAVLLFVVVGGTALTACDPGQTVTMRYDGIASGVTICAAEMHEDKVDFEWCFETVAPGETFGEIALERRGAGNLRVEIFDSAVRVRTLTTPWTGLRAAEFFVSIQ
jgi:hypothetical protein